MSGPYRFSNASTAELDTCRPELQTIAREAIRATDFAVICGRRTPEEQRRLVEQGYSRTMRSKHVAGPGELSRAMDLCPCVGGRRVDGSDAGNLKYFYFMAGAVMTIAEAMNIKLRWGGDWDGDGNFRDQTFNDLYHFELADR